MAYGANVLDWDIIVSYFELWSRYYVQFWINTLGKDINSLIPPPAIDYLVLQLFCKHEFGIK